MNTLELARKKALEIALAAAQMEKPSEIITHLDDLLEILTGSKVFDDIGLSNLKRSEPPAPEPEKTRNPPDPSQPSEIILNLLRHPDTPRDGLTMSMISRKTHIYYELVKRTVQTLHEKGLVFSPEKTSHKKYSIVDR
ncbi:MAG: hypothetical protein OXL96_07700 [Candidatus Poribacteria bacterium]|nr:hypothetical protein [Candidatus Poribacteria bacterium]MDE0397668.1 hypothetical protein [Candidatus Poribacteria bacterium]